MKKMKYFITALIITLVVLAGTVLMAIFGYVTWIVHVLFFASLSTFSFLIASVLLNEWE